MNNLKNKSIIISCATLGSGGAERVISILSTALIKEYGAVEIILWKHHDIFYHIDERITIVDIEAKIYSSSTFKKMKWFRKYIKLRRPDIILSFLYPYSIRVLTSLLFTDQKVIVAERRNPQKVKGGKLIEWFRNLLYLKATAITVQTIRNMMCYPSFLRKNINVIYNPVSLSDDYIGSANTTIKEKEIVTVGRLVPEKNHELLIKSFAEFRNDHSCYKLTIWGEGPLRKKLQELIDSLGLHDCVFLKGNSNEVLREILNSEIFVLPSNTEGMPNALIEAMCLGLPCISTNVSGAADLIISGENGLLINVGDQSALISCLKHLSDNYEYRTTLGLKAVSIYKLVKKDHIINQWKSLINTSLI